MYYNTLEILNHSATTSNVRNTPALREQTAIRSETYFISTVTLKKL